MLLNPDSKRRLPLFRTQQRRKAGFLALQAVLYFSKAVPYFSETVPFIVLNTAAPQGKAGFLALKAAPFHCS